MLNLVNVGHKSLADYATIATRGLMDEIRRLAEPLRGKRVVHLSATAFGGGVAEINYTLIPLMQDAGLETEWRIIRGAEEFFNVTKTIHNALQGNPQGLTAEQCEVFARYQALNAREFEDTYDFVVVHDPQPVGIIDHFPASRAQWIWRGHIDFSAPNPDVLNFLLPSLGRYDATIFHMREYVPHHDGLPPAYIWPPAIDPLAPKNMALSAEDAAYIVDQFGIDVDRPLVTQVSRFDPWKDPLGVIDAYREVKQSAPEVQLALVGSMAHDDPEGWDFYNRTVAYADGDPDINIVSNPTLWFLQHYLWALAQAPNVNKGLHHAWDEGYVAVNRGFADAVLAELEREPEAAVFFHDYHLYLAPRFVRDVADDATLTHFIHVPWAQPDYWHVLPERIRRAIHDGVLANDVVGFHTRRWRRNFLRCCFDVLG